MRRGLVVLILMLTQLSAAGAAQAVVVDMGGAGNFGVALVPGTNRGSGIQTATAPCTDPWLAPDLGGPALPSAGLCYHGGPVVHSNETFDLAWDPLRRDWAGTRNYVETFLRNVADGSNTLTSPYALTTQYRDAGGRVANASLYGGGCIDYGIAGGSSCQFGAENPKGTGADYPASGCPVTGTNQSHQEPNGSIDRAPNDVCLTDAQLKAELATVVSQEGVIGHTHGGYTPVVVLMTPAGVVDCLDGGGTLCSSNASMTPPLPSLQTATSGGSIPPGVYTVKISYVTAGGESVASAPQSITVPAPAPAPSPSGGGTGATPPPSATITIASPPSQPGATGWYAYVTTAGGTSYFLQQPSGSPTPIGQSLLLQTVSSARPANPPLSASGEFCAYHSSITVGGLRVPYVVQPWTAWTGCDELGLPQPPDIATDAGQRLVSPLSQAQIAALVNPGLDGWSALDGSEINDNGYPHGCGPLGTPADNATFGSTTYVLQHEFNNAGVLESDPNAPGCAGGVVLVPRFVAPSAVSPGDLVEFDGSKTASTLMVPRAGYAWNFGDGATATGPSVGHTFARGGTYTVTLTVTDRGGNVQSLAQTITILGGPPPPPPALTAYVQLLPQSLRAVLRGGLAVRLSVNMAADGFTTLMVPRSVARRAHLRSGSGATVVIGRGTLAGVRPGTRVIHLHIPTATARRLARLGHLSLSLRLTLMGAGRLHRTVDAAGSY